MTTGSETPSPRYSRAPLGTLLTADGISQTGNMLTMLAIPWFVLDTTGSAARTGLTAAVGALAIMVAGLFGGALVDRLGHKRTSVIGDLGGAVTVALIPFLHHTVGLAFWQLLSLVFLGALLRGPGWTARQSLYATVASLGNVGLERANAGAQMVGRMAGLVGPLLAGVLIRAIGETNVLWLDAGTFVVSATLIAVGIPARMPDDEAAMTADARRGYWEELRDGLRFIRGDRLVFWLIVVFALGSLLAEPIHSVVLPVYADKIFDSSIAWGVMAAGLAVGSLLGNVLFIALAPRLPRRAVLIAGFAVRDLGFWLMVSIPPLEAMVGIIAMQAIFLEPTNPISATLFQERVPEALRGRVFGILLALPYAARAVGVLTYGLLLERIGLRDTLIVLAAMNLVVPITIWLAPALRTMTAPNSRRLPKHALG